MHNPKAIQTSFSFISDGPTDTAPLAGDKKTIAEVLVSPLNSALSYLVPEELAAEVAPGSRVLVPLGRRTVDGFVSSVSETKSAQGKFKLKAILASKVPHQAFRVEQLEFFQWVANYYCEPLSNVLDLAVPRYVAGKSQNKVILVKEPAKESKLGPSQKLVIDFLKANRGEASLYLLKNHSRSATTVVRTLELRGFVKVETKVNSAGSGLFPKAPIYSPKLPTLNSEQQYVVDRLNAQIGSGSFESSLLFGVTGSGKTEVYVHLIATALSKNIGSLILVPEISLTPQLVDRLEERLGGKIAVLHSGLPARERWAAWQALIEGNVHVALGARSAIFAPVANLGLIIVDEEHDSSFKQNEGFRYNGRDLSIARAKLLNCPVLLGSATPALESYQHSKSGKYQHYSLSGRHSPTPVAVAEIIDLSRIKKKDMASASISPQLFQALKQTFENKTQAFILYNRRGFASYLQCNGCNHSLNCPFCSVTLTYHQRRNSLLCHYCGHNVVPPLVCPACAATENSISSLAEPKPLFSEQGAGTERVHEELKKLFPNITVGRLDRDIASDLKSYREILDGVRSGKTDVLVGTQMIAKGHDLPRVTLVGVVDCDVGLHIPDFRASERVFQLLTQAAGRAGRHQIPGRVIFQTRTSRHPSIVYATRTDTKSFIESELETRKALGYPPFVRILRIITSGEELDLVEQTANSIVASLKETADVTAKAVIVLGPVPAPFGKLRGEWRWHILCKSLKTNSLLRVMQLIKRELVISKKIKVVCDLDPQDML